MLEVDLVRLGREVRLPIDATVPADDPAWDADLHLAAPLEIHLLVQQAGADVVARGRIAGRVRRSCDRCLVPVEVEFAEAVTLVYRADAEPAEAEADEVYVLPRGARRIDLTPAVREHTVLAAPAFVLCRQDCRGLCARCGADRNRVDCGCRAAETDERWAALRRLQGGE